MKIKYLHTMVRVKNIEQSLEFYCNLLGLKEIRRKNSDKLNINRFVDYPFDEKWSVKYSEASNLQEQIHLLIANREQSTPRLQFKNFLKSIKYKNGNLNKKIPAIFLDRDGVINLDKNDGKYQNPKKIISNVS